MPRHVMTITTLAEQIGTLHREIQLRGADRYEEMYVLLTKAKKEAGEGKWLQWLQDNKDELGFGERQAQLYLREPALRNADQVANRERVAAHRARVQRITPATPPRDEAHRRQREKWYEQKKAELARKRDELKRLRKMFEREEVEKRKLERKEEQERREHAKKVRDAEVKAIESGLHLYFGVGEDQILLARKIVSTGYHTLSLKAHPDTGGSAEQLAALTKAKTWLNDLISNPALTTVRRKS